MLKLNLKLTRNIRVYQQLERHTSCSPLLTLMPTSSTHPGSSSQPHPVSPTSDTRAPGFDGSEEVGAALWKRRYLALQESLNTEGSSKRKAQ